jgi:hypothetical protein
LVADWLTVEDADYDKPFPPAPPQILRGTLAKPAVWCVSGRSRLDA